MGKRKKKRSAKNTTKPKKRTPRPSKKPKSLFLALAVGVALVITGIYFLSQGKDPKKPVLVGAPTERENLTLQRTGSAPSEVRKTEKKNVKLRETRPTLSPEIFMGSVRRAYEIAREIPEVLDRLYCYCRCRENFNHKNLLTCYVDNHAAT